LWRGRPGREVGLSGGISEQGKSKSVLEPVAAEKFVRFLPKRDSVRQPGSLVFRGHVLYWLVPPGVANCSGRMGSLP
jgi:hypothetical protein